jgi:hypothetical protein
MLEFIADIMEMISLIIVISIIIDIIKKNKK